MRLLGIWVGQSMTFSAHGKVILRSRGDRLKILYKAPRAKWGLESRLLCSIYKAIIQSKILYGVSFYGRFLPAALIRKIDINIIR